MCKTDTVGPRPAAAGEALVALTFFRPFLEVATALGVSTTAVLCALGLAPFDADEPMNPLVRLGAGALVGFCDLVGSELSTRAFHLGVAVDAALGSFDVAELVMRSADDVGELLDWTARLARLSFDYPIELRRTSSEVILNLVPVGAANAAALVAETFFARLLVVIHHASGERARPRQVCFRHGAPAYVESLTQVLGVEPRFSAHAAELVFDAALLARPLRTRDPHLLRMLTRYARECLERLPQSDRLHLRVRQAILERLPESDPSIEKVAAALGMSARTLQRKLSDEQTSYQQLLDSVRLERSIEYLSRSEMTIAEAAARLGFADLTSFHRAFKRWMGTPPAEYRRRHSVAAATPRRATD